MSDISSPTRLSIISNTSKAPPAFTLHKPKKEFISSTHPKASAMAELLEIRWSQPKRPVLPLSPAPVKKGMCPREESNSHFILRTDLFCPLNYEGVAFILFLTYYNLITCPTTKNK